jgi:hypothetical protein
VAVGSSSSSWQQQQQKKKKHSFPLHISTLNTHIGPICYPYLLLLPWHTLIATTVSTPWQPPVTAHRPTWCAA